MLKRNIYHKLAENITSVSIEEIYLFHHTVFIKTQNSVGLSTIASREITSPPRDFGSLQNKKLDELAQYYNSDNYMEVAIGMAAINASFNLSHESLNLNYDLNAYEYIKDLKSYQNVALIGRFPFIEEKKEIFNIKNLWVFEQNPNLDKGELSVDLYQEYLPKADVVIITGMTFANKTFHLIYPHLTNSFNILTGPSTPLCPKLFEYNIDALCGVIVEDHQSALLSFSQGASSKQAKGLRKFTLEKNNIL